MSGPKAVLPLLAFVLSFLSSRFVTAADPTLPAAHAIGSTSVSSIGVKECAACHSAPNPIYDALGVTRFVRLVEATEWRERDKHAYAYQLVRQDLSPDELKKKERRSNQLSIEITTKLNWKPAEREHQFEQKCLTCHVGLNAEEPPTKVDSKFNMQMGVQCESCHGPGSEYTKREYHQQVSWRTKTSEEKAELGMWNLSSPSIAAKICLSCHLGNIDEGRFVSHDMYAAGHPVLPPFDLQVFLDAMPPHWRPLQEKPSFENQSQYNRVHFNIPGTSDEIQTAILGSFDKTRRSMLGGLVANDLGIELIHQGVAKPDSWGDYSNYNCMGCHQELKKNSIQVRPQSRTPGRPFPANWLTLDYPNIHVSSRDTHATLTREMLASFDSVPFGDAKRLNQLSDQHLQSLAGRFQDRRKMEKQVMSRTDVVQWLDFLNTCRKESLTDYWVAKQTAWMVCVAIDELVDRGELTKDSVSSSQKELRDLLLLDLQSPQKQSVLSVQKDILKKAQHFDSAKCKELIGLLVNTAVSSQ